MRALLDVNVLIALLDQNHIAHDPAWQWMEANIESGWATSPITQNACIRIMSQPSYPTEFHQFWPDGVSILTTTLVNWDLLIGPKQITDIYLLALAVQNDGRFVTFDTRVSPEMVHGALSQHLAVI